jgi:hypothetical protein
MTPLERVHAEEMFAQLAADAIQRRHPQAVWLAEKGRGRPIPLKDDALEAACERLAIWLAEQPDLPVDPDSWLARHAPDESV